MRGALATLAVIVLAAALPGLAEAHLGAVATTPAADSLVETPPTAVGVRLSETLDPVGEGISVTAPDGREVATGPAVVRGFALSRHVDAQTRGTYVVEWLVVGGDSHPVRGTFRFSVGEVTSTSLPGHLRGGVALESVGRWLALLGFALGFGVPFAALLSGRMTTRLWRLVSAGIALMIVAEPVALLGQTATLAPSRAFDLTFAQDVLLTSYGHITGLRLGGALALWALTGALRQGSSRLLWTIPALGVLVALIHADASHRIASLPAGMSFLLAAAHLVAFGVWLGCIAVAFYESRSPVLSHTAVLAGLVLVLTGSALAFGHLGSPSELVTTAYGVALSAKLALVLAAFALGAAAWHRAELAAALAVVAAACVLVSLVPPL